MLDNKNKNQNSFFELSVNPIISQSPVTNQDKLSSKKYESIYKISDDQEQGSQQMRNSWLLNIQQPSMIRTPGYKFSLIGTMLLLTTLITTSSVMPLSVALPLEGTLLKLSWRNTNMIPFLILISFVDLKTKAKDFSLSQIWGNKNIRIGIIQLSLSFNLVQIFFILSGQYTIMSHASIFSNLGGAMLVIHRVILRKPTHRWEYSGVIIALLGSVISVLDKDVKKIDESNQSIPFGDACGILSSIFAAYFFQKNSQVIQDVPSSIVVCLTIIFSEILLVIFGLSFDTFTLDFNIHTGVFGFLSKDYFLYTFFALGLFCGAMSIYTATLVLKYYPAVVLLITSLFEPLLCQAISCLMNIDKAPGLLTYLGGMFTLIGILGVAYGGQLLEKAQNRKNLSSNIL